MTIRHFSAVLLTAALLATIAGCSDNGTDPTTGGGTGTTVSFAADLQPVFNATCTGCHGAGGFGGLDLTTDVAWANLLGVESMGYAPRQRVVSGNPDESVLYLKINGDPSVGGRMPQGVPLDVDTIELFRVWIVQGALKN
ncbi:MAG: hypothetical protein QNL91_01185 [Candidatus Krumholzibacteria bacterium]|nr:hypothetical protein [Candidatus Krumholzibacteria bacterium]